MKKIITLSSFITLWVALSFSFCSCQKNDEQNGEQNISKHEVRSPYVENTDAKAVVFWIDPYISDVKEIKVTDMQSNQVQVVAKGVERAEFDMPTNKLQSYNYKINVVKTSGEVSTGVIVRLINDWAMATHQHIDYNSSEIPQSGMFFKNKPVQTVDVFDIRTDDNISKLASAVMQGVINQEYAKTFLVWQQQDLTQLIDAQCSYSVQSPASTPKNKGFAAMFNKYKGEFNCLVIWDEQQPWSWSMAQIVSAQEKGIPVTAQMKQFIDNELDADGLEVKDIRSQWTTKAQAYNWAMETYKGKYHPTLLFSGGLRGDYKDNPWRMYDYVAASKGFAFWLNEFDGDDKQIMDKIFVSGNYPVGTSVFGYGMNANGDDLNKITNIHNAGFVVSDYYGNGSYWCSFPSKSFQQRKGIAQQVKPGKVYVAISLSDGDNIQFDANMLYDIFKKGKRRGEVPVATTLAAGLQELNPKLLEFYYKNMTPNDELTAGPSGFQFIYGDYYAQSGKYTEWLTMNKKWMSTAGFHTAYLWGTEEHNNYEQYMKESGVDAVLDGSGLTNSSPRKVVDGVVRIDQGTHCRTEGDVYRDLMSVAPSERRPIFRHIYLLTAYYGYKNNEVVLYEQLIKELERAEKECPNTYEYMLPMDLAASIKKYVAEGGIY